jgi:cytochrome c oxidase assembly protein subunit 15
MTTADKKKIRIWYWSGAALIFLIVVVGGITRLSDSGLSMTDWKPLLGSIPPITDTQWAETFDRYKQFPEYQQRNTGMSLSEFKAIYFWEYLHRMLGRFIGLVFIIPFGYFIYKKSFNTRQLKRATILLGLGFAQGFMGWYMVKSGLVDVPYVSPYRLAAHLSLAFLIFGLCIWFALDLYEHKIRRENLAGELKTMLQIFGLLLIIQIVWGAFVAGLNAGHVYNTFPKMYTSWVPSEAWLLEPFVKNLTENPAAVQFIHRVTGTLLGFFVIGIWIRTLFKASKWQTKKWAFWLFSIVLIQYAIGVFTLIYHVPLWLGVTHQAAALILFGCTIGFYHHLKVSENKYIG